MDIQNLKAFKAVAQLHSFSIAAEQLHLTQPAVTKRIQALEQQLNVHLFDRIGRNLFLTEAGTCLLPKAEEILRLVASSKQALSDLSGEISGTLRLITSHHIGLHRLPTILKEYKQLYPQVQLHIQFKNSADIYQDILSGHGDLGITTEEQETSVSKSSAKIISRNVWKDKLAFVVAPHHPLLKKSRLTLNDIAQYSAILPDEKFHTSQIIKNFFSEHQLNLVCEEGLRTNYLETIKALVSIGESWSVLPEIMLDSNLLTPLKPRGVKLARQLVCISHKDRSLNNASRALLELLIP